MASTINASTTSTSGLVYNADASGVLQLQSNGVTGLTLNGNTATVNNLTVNGTLTAAATNLTECAQLASTVIYNIPDGGIGIVPFDTVIIDENITVNRTASTVGGIEAYHWRHSTPGIYRIRYDVRTTNDSWNMISVCRNNNAALPAGNGFRTGSPAGFMGTTLECLYRVSNTEDRFGLFHWCPVTTSAMLAHDGTPPPASFFVTPEVGTAPTTGYYSSIIITKL